MKILRLIFASALLVQLTGCVVFWLNHDGFSSSVPLSLHKENIDRDLLGNYYTDNIRYDERDYRFHVDISVFADDVYLIRVEKSIDGSAYTIADALTGYITTVDDVMFLNLQKENSTRKYYFARVDKYFNGDLKVQFVGNFTESGTTSHELFADFNKHCYDESFYDCEASGDEGRYLHKN